MFIKFEYLNRINLICFVDIVLEFSIFASDFFISLEQIKDNFVVL